MQGAPNPGPGPNPPGPSGCRHRRSRPPLLAAPFFPQDPSFRPPDPVGGGILSPLLRDPGGERRVVVARTESSFASYSPAESDSFLSRMGRGRGAACAPGGGNSFPGGRGAATRRSACPFFSSSPGLLLGATGGWRRAPPRGGGDRRPPHHSARPAPLQAPGQREWKSDSDARVPPPPPPPPRPWVGSRETCWRETRGDSHPPAALPGLP